MNDRDVLPRAMEPRVERLLRTMPILVVTGARQTGKSTLVRHGALARRRSYVTLDDVEMLDRAERQPQALLQGHERITIDEVQRAPELLLAIKRSVDERRVPGRFVLTGSANLLTMKRVSESLAGRAAYVSLWPMTRREQRGLGTTGIWSQLLDTKDDDWPELLDAQPVGPVDWRALALRGGYPTPATQLTDDDDRRDWFAGYTNSYLERDVRDLSAGISLVDFRRLIRAAALRIGNLLNQTELARDVSQAQATVHRHLDLLETSYQFVRVPAFAVNRTKRLIKTPKLFATDTGLAMYLAGETEPRGAHLENMVLLDLLAWRELLPERPDVCYWRTASGDEVDFVVDHPRGLLAVEVKASTRPRLDDAKGLRTFRDEYGRKARAGLLLHAGRETTWLADGVLAAPFWRVM